VTRYLRLETPADIPIATECRRLDIPASQDWLAVVNSALLEMTRVEAWQRIEEDHITPAEAAARSLQLYELYLMSGQVGACEMTCDQLIACIANDPDAQAALLAWLLANFSGAGVDPASIYPNLTILQQTVGEVAAEDCDASHKYGLCYTLIESLDSTITDLLDAAALAADSKELIKDILDWIPVFGKLWDLVVDAASWLSDHMILLYPAAYDETSHEAVACAVYCNMGDKCEVTVDDLLQSMRTLLAAYNPPGAFAGIEESFSWVFSIIAGGNTVIVAAMYWLLLTAWSAGSTWLGLNPNILLIDAQTYLPIDPTGICDVCPGCDSWLGGEDSAGDWTIAEGGGVYGTYNEAEDRFEGTWIQIPNSGKRVDVYRDFGALPITDVFVSWDCENTRGATGAFVIQIDGVNKFYSQAYPPNGQGVAHLTLDGSDVDRVYISAACHSVDGASSGHIYITGITICY
jgi:hypothetical protein